MESKVKHVEDKKTNDLLYKIAETHMLTWKDVYDRNKEFKNKKMLMPLPVPVVLDGETYNAMCLMEMSDDPKVPQVTPQLVYYDKDKYELCLSPKVKEMIIQEAEGGN